MKRLSLLAIALALSSGIAVNAQNSQQRKVLSDSIDVSALDQLSTQFQSNFELNEAKVQKYLRDNPKVQRTQEVNGRTQTIVRIDETGNPVYQVARDGSVSAFNGTKNLASGQLIKADSLYSGGSIGVNITGTGMVAGVWEPGMPRDTHELLVGKVTNAAGQSAFAVGGNGDHASHVTGTMIGRSVPTHPSARGIAFDGTSINYDAANDLTEMTGFATASGLISNHSYGDANTQTANLWKYGAYDTEAKDWDLLLKTAFFYLPFIAGGNEQQSSGNAAKAGYDIMTGPAASKNTMTVGAVNGDKTMSDYSNWGPTDDGRVKPEIVAKGTGIDSAQSASDTAYSGNGAASSGTSYASPAAAAGGLLLQQYYQTKKGLYMRSSTLKTLMMGTAEDLGQPGPDHKFGYGLLNVEAAALAIKKSATVPLGSAGVLANSRGSVVMEVATNPTNNSSAEISFEVFAKGGVPLVVNMGWTDDEGPEQLAGEGVDPTTSRLVYDFDMMVRNVTAGGDKWPWVLPTMATRTADATVATNWFQANGGNFRQVIIPAPTANQVFRIYVRKSSGSPAAARALSFVVTGTVESAFFTVTASAGANGTLTCGGAATTQVNANATTGCTAVPASGFTTASISGCSGVATGSGVNSYTTGAVTADCTVSATFAAVATPVNGACGTANGVATTVAPTANLCADASTPTVTSGANSFTWTCAGSNGGTNASCAAPRQYTVTATAGANGTLTCGGAATTQVNSGTTASCTAVPASGFATASISGCNGVATGSGVNSYTTGAVTANCTVSATFAALATPVNGACGTANGVATTVAPTANRCADASTPTVTSGASSFTWTCAGSNGGTNASCAAPRQYTVTATAAANGTLSCTSPAVTSGGTMTCTAVPASGYVTSSISGCNGVATGSGINAYTTGVVTADCTVTASFAARAVAVEPAVPVPTLQNWALLMLALSMAGFGWIRMRRSL